MACPVISPVIGILNIIIKKVKAADIKRLLKQIEGTPHEALLATAMIRSMQKAVYSTKNIGHFGLAFDYYTHFTSPIRRYPDLLVHRILAKHLHGEPFGDRDIVTFGKIAEHSTNREIDAAKAERISVPIHGKLDAIVESADDVDVFDYKTRQAMSVNAIKGLTKDGSGDYFRQLVFYKILLQSEPRWKSRKITPALVFVSPDDKGRCPIISLPILPEDIEAVKRQIQSVIDSVWSGEIARARCEDRDCEWCGLRSLA